MSPLICLYCYLLRRIIGFIVSGVISLHNSLALAKNSLNSGSCFQASIFWILSQDPPEIKLGAATRTKGRDMLRAARQVLGKCGNRRVFVAQILLIILMEPTSLYLNITPIFGGYIMRQIYFRYLLVLMLICIFCIVPVIAQTSSDNWAPWVTMTSTNSATINWR